ncbi:MAG: mannose-1-phosphate guanylyltransferase [Bacteroidales bacterium]
MNNRYAIIMAGGIGSRFWPLSRSDKPKQFLDILGNGETLIQQTFRRIKAVCQEDHIIIVTNTEHKNIVIDQLGVRPERVLAEPNRRNTAPCIAYGTSLILNEDPDAVIVVTPADHLILKEEEFRKIINEGFDFAQQNEVLITLGIKPDKPETGYGYIQADETTPVTVNTTGKLMKVIKFTEKPDTDLAKKFIDSGDFYWNSGIFIWSAKAIMKALDRFLPDISSVFSEGKSLLGTTREDEFISGIYNSIRSVSIDFGVLEKADNVYVLSANMGWSDLGTWSSLYSHTTNDKNANAIVLGKAYSYDSKGNIISIKPGKVAILQGLNEYIIVDTDDALLIIRKDEEQKIKEYLEDIKNEI